MEALVKLKSQKDDKQAINDCNIEGKRAVNNQLTQIEKKALELKKELPNLKKQFKIYLKDKNSVKNYSKPVNLMEIFESNLNEVYKEIIKKSEFWRTKSF